MTAILEVTGVSKRYGDACAVDCVSFDIQKGEVLTLLGRSGCGKSTTLRLVAGLERPNEGQIRLRGKVVVSTSEGIFVAPEKRSIGLVFQSYAVWPHMTVGENIAYPLKIRGERSSDISDKVLRMADLVGLTDYLQRPALQLSGGQQQRVALGRALIHEPDLLLLDEPFSNLDTELREELRIQMKHLQSRLGTSVLYVTHDQMEAMDLSHRVAVMYKGQIQQLDSPDEVYERPANFFIQRFVGSILSFDGHVSARVETRTMVDLGEGIKLSLPGDFSHPPADTPVRVTMRPEDLRLTDREEPGSHSIPVVVKEVSYLGHRRDCRLLSAGNMNTMPVAKNIDLRIDDTYWLVFDPERLRLWPNVNVP